MIGYLGGMTLCSVILFKNLEKMATTAKLGSRKLLGYSQLSENEIITIKNTLSRLRTTLKLKKAPINEVLNLALHKGLITRIQGDEIHAVTHYGEIGRWELKKELISKAEKKEKMSFIDKVRKLEDIHLLKYVSAQDIFSVLSENISNEIKSMFTIPNIGNLQKYIKQRLWDKVGDIIWNLVRKRVPWLQAGSVGIDTLIDLIDIGKRKRKGLEGRGHFSKSPKKIRQEQDNLVPRSYNIYDKVNKRRLRITQVGTSFLLQKYNKRTKRPVLVGYLDYKEEI